MDSLNLTVLSASHRSIHRVSGCNYDILDNANYADQFFYIPINNLNQKFLLRSSDIVAQVIYMGEETTLSKDDLIKQIESLIFEKD